ncbi:RNA polymerase sigma factor [Kutzneria sp. CA-103260]|uniref:RNA polymerase sigma factor n=1 Tax=Kutzneria sp. CA-103260 TaxID=2802641 RepID=UPI001BAD5C6F|nr:sigma-70 family RNA polymerase sigma factor [Kutzneria sp. CA-103260]
MESAADTTLWGAIAEDDHAAFTTLYERHAQAVWNYAYRLTGSWSTAEDVLATAFMTAWQRRADVVLIRDSALPWLYTVAANLVRNDHRRRGRFLRLVPKLAVLDEARDHAEEFVERDHTQQRLTKVLAAVDRLPAAEKEAVQLCMVGRMSTADAAQLLGITEVSVRSRLSRARTRLRRMTEGSMTEGGMTEESFDE